MLQNLSHIVDGCKNNDPRSQEALYRHCYPEMIRICMRYVSGDADHAGALFNQAMLKVFKNIGQYRNEGEINAWIRKILVNVCIDHCRLKTKFSAADITDNKEHLLPVLPDIYHKLSANDIMNLVYGLPKNTGLVFNLFVMEGYKHDEIAGMLGISSGTSKWHLNEARRLLKEKIEQLYKKENLANAI